MSKMTPILEVTFDFLKKHGELRKLSTINATPHFFVPVGLENETPKGGGTWGHSGVLNGLRVYQYPNRQSVNKLVLLGYAEYADKKRTILKFVDRDAIQTELERKAAIADALKLVFQKGFTLCQFVDNICTCEIMDTDDLMRYDKAKEDQNVTF